MLLLMPVVGAMIVTSVVVVQLACFFKIVLFTGTKTKTNHKNE